MTVHQITPTEPLNPELADVLPELIARDVTIVITPAVRWLDPCSGCRELTDFPPDEAVATVVYTVTKLPSAYRYTSTCCPSCLPSEVDYQLRRGARVTVEIPERIGGAA